SVVAAGQKVLNNGANRAVAFARIGIVGVVFGRVPLGVFDVDMDDEWFDVGVEFPRVLFAPGLGLAAVIVENWIGGIEEPFEAGDIVEEFEGKGPAHTAVVHAVFVDGLNAGVEEHFGDFAQAAEAFLFHLIFAVAHGKAHDANKFCAELLHARNGAFGFSE